MKYNRIISMVLICIMLFSFGVNAVEIDKEKSNEKAIELDNQIQELFDQRAQLFLEETPDMTKVEKIEKKLKKLGVEFLTPEEVDKKFPNSKNKIKNADTGDVSVQVATPSSSNVQWASYRLTNYYYNGEYYNIQRLIASPNKNSSNLKKTVAKVIHTQGSWKAGAFAVIKSAAYSGIGSAASNIPGASVLISAYDALKEGYSAMSTTTVIECPTINYTTATSLTAVFMYVRKENQSDTWQELSHISTKAVTDAHYAIPDFSYTNYNGTWVVYPNVVDGSRMITSTPSGYNDIGSAVKAYANSRQVIANVGYITISGQENPDAVKINPVYPLSPVYIK